MKERVKSRYLLVFDLSSLKEGIAIRVCVEGAEIRNSVLDVLSSTYLVHILIEFMSQNIQLDHPQILYPQKLSEIIDIRYFKLLSFMDISSVFWGRMKLGACVQCAISTQMTSLPLMALAIILFRFIDIYLISF